MTMAHQKESIIPSDRTAKVAQAADRRRLLQAKNANRKVARTVDPTIHERIRVPARSSNPMGRSAMIAFPNK